jgi:hypothetical protein
MIPHVFGSASIQDDMMRPADAVCCCGQRLQLRLNPDATEGGSANRAGMRRVDARAAPSPPRSRRRRRRARTSISGAAGPAPQAIASLSAPLPPPLPLPLPPPLPPPLPAALQGLVSSESA